MNIQEAREAQQCTYKTDLAEVGYCIRCEDYYSQVAWMQMREVDPGDYDLCPACWLEEEQEVQS